MTTLASVLTIAGSDSSGGAGIQADIKTIQAHGLFATSAITAITAQNTTGVRSVQEITPALVDDQINAVFEDIRPDAVKIGMVSSPEIVHVIARALRRHNATNVVVDPVMVATSGSALIKSDAIHALEQELFPLAQVITPNLAEAQTLANVPIQCAADMEQAATTIAASVAGEGPAVLVKGGHQLPQQSSCAANDVLRLPTGQLIWLQGTRINNPNTHGTGCTLSSAIACGLAKGMSVEDACRAAKRYIEGALAAQLDLGAGSGPLHHNYNLDARTQVP